MRIEQNITVSYLFGCPDGYQDKLFKEFSYVNKSLLFQATQYNKKKRQILYVLTNLKGFTLQEAQIEFTTQYQKMRINSKVCLLKLLDNGSIEFPSGLMEKLIKFLKEEFSVGDIEIQDNRIKPEILSSFPYVTEPPPLRPYQEEAVSAALEKCQGTIVAGTGTGKTAAAQEIIHRLGKKTLYVVPSLSIMDQTIRRFETYFGKHRIGQLSGGKRRIRDITIACAPSVLTTTQEDWKEFDALLLDESHHSPSDTIETICYKIMPHCFYRINMTATYMRADGADLAIEAAAFPPIFKYTTKRAVQEGYLAKPYFVMFQLPQNGSSYSGDNHLQIYKNHVMRNRFLNDLVVDHAQKFIAAGKRVLVLVREKEHGNVLAARIPGSVFVRTKGVVKRGNAIEAPFVDVNDAVRDFNAGKIMCLIGTSIIGEGTDLVPVDVIFMLTAQASKVSVLQSIGRGLRRCEGKEGVTIIDYFFNSHQTAQRHSWLRHGYYKELSDIIDIIDLSSR